jgi:dTDP-6-deoxy-L-talose 4-dehydrogenase (NAD+)
VTRVVAVTGATGFVGRQVVRALAASGAAVVPVVRTPRAAAVAAWPGVARVVATDDLFAEPSTRWHDALAGVDTLVHAAWYAEPGRYLLATENLGCLAGSVRLMEGAMAAGVARVVGVGTCLEYAPSPVPLPVDAPLDPVTPYAAAKAATWLALSRLLPQQGVAFAWCRLFHLYGEGEDPRRLVPYLRARLAAGEVATLSAGTQQRDFLDVAEAGARVAQVALGAGTGAFNICSGVPVTVRALAERIAAQAGRPDLLSFGNRPLDPGEPPVLVGVPTPTG